MTDKEIIVELNKENLRLNAQVQDLVRQYNRLEKERDAAVADLKQEAEREEGLIYCTYCKHLEKNGCCYTECRPFDGVIGWEWRGVKEEQ